MVSRAIFLSLSYFLDTIRHIGGLFYPVKVRNNKRSGLHSTPHLQSHHRVQLCSEDCLLSPGCGWRLDDISDLTMTIIP